MIVKNKLLNYKDLIIYQDTEYFNFSLDSVLLSHFVTIKSKDKKCMDLCTGNAPIPLLLTTRTNIEINGIELQKESYSLGKKSIIENNLEQKINIINDNIKNIGKYYSNNTFDIITCNPPYFKLNKNSNINNNNIKSIARHEIMIELNYINRKTIFK
ncbi:MAG: methyltransferase [Bacilli bacterium]